ncbi:MAG TPA: hypothetical protein VF163_03435, partial [Micromonosporaceae bacterium]
PMAVCRAFATAMLGHDTRTDTGPEQAWRRAAPYLVDPLSTQWPQRADARWTEWVAHRAWTLVRLDEWVGDDLPDEPGVAYRSVLASTTPVGADGWRGPTERHAVHCALIRSGHGWRIVDVVVDDLDGER